MRKLYAFALMAASICAISCNSTKDSGSSSTLPEPATADKAQVITFKNPAVIGALSLKSIELTEASRYIVEYVQSKASSGAQILYGTYSYSNGKYILSGFGSVSISGSKVTIEPSTAGGESVEVEATIRPTTTSDNLKVSACRNWKVSKAILGLTGGSFGQAGIEKSFNGLDMKTIGDWAKEKAKISDEDLTTLYKYSVKEICMTGAGSFVVDFASADPFYGTFSMSGSNFTFTMGKEDIPFISEGKIAGTLDFSGSTCTIKSKATVVYKNETYGASLELTLSEVK